MAICTTHNCCSGCELIKTNKVICSGDQTVEVNKTLTATISNDASPDPFASGITLNVTNEDIKIFSTGCDIVYNGNGSFTITFAGFIICETFTLDDGDSGNTQDVEIISRICTPTVLDFTCKVDDACVPTNPNCQIESIGGNMQKPQATVSEDGTTITINQTLDSVTVDLVIDEIVQLLVNLCKQIPGTVNIITPE